MKRILVVAPASVLLNWRNEINAWQTSGLPVHVIRPGTATDMTADGWYVVNYDICGRYEAQMKAREWDLYIFDEAQMLKTRDAKRTLTLLGGRRKSNGGGYETVEPVPARRKLMLTGTPIMNRPEELFPLLHCLDPKRWPSFGAFGKRYCGAQWNGFRYDTGGATNLDELNQRLRETVMVRRLKKDVLTELPAKIRQVVEIEVEDPDVRRAIDAENDVYERTEMAVAEASTEMLKAEAEGDESAYRHAVARLRSAQGIAFSEMARVRHETALAKVPSVIEHLRNVEGKCLVFAHHIDVIAALCNALADRGVLKITGETPNEKRQPIVDRFQKDDSIQYFVGNIKAAGIGLTLTAASQVVFAELDWTPSAITQAEDRAHRIGQRESVTVQHLVFDGSLDAKMAKMVVEKQKVIDAALDAKIKSSPAVDVGQLLAPTTKSFASQDSAAHVLGGCDTLAGGQLDDGAFEYEASQQKPKFSAHPDISDDQISAVHSALRIVAGSDHDHARELNGMGFNKMDTGFGCDLAQLDRLTPRQAAAAMRMMRKYKRQYPEALYARMFGGES